VGGVQGATDERVCDVGRPAGLISHWQKEREMIHSQQSCKLGTFRPQILRHRQ